VQDVAAPTGALIPCADRCNQLFPEEYTHARIGDRER